MTSKPGSLGTPRFGIALIWFVDGGAPDGAPAAPSSPPAASGPPVTPPVTPEDIELVRDLTGLAPEELVARLHDIAAGYAGDPGALRAEILRITGGDEIAAGHLMQLIQACTPDGDAGDGGTDAEPTGQEEGRTPGRVIDLSLHVPHGDGNADANGDANGQANGDDEEGNP
jgi:hypothetical protein